jgi:hypothetical protein
MTESPDFMAIGCSKTRFVDIWKILKCYWLGFLNPVMAQLPDQIERTSDADDVVWRGLGARSGDRLVCIGNDFEIGCMMRGDFG